MRRLRPAWQLAIGIAATALMALLWHGPLGAGDRFAARVDAHARFLTDYFEMKQVDAHMATGPLSRRILLSGPADDFQRQELVRVMDEIPGIVGASWSGARRIPMWIEAILFAWTGFGTGLVIAYLLELRRRGRRWDRF